MLNYPYNGFADLRPIFFHELGHFIAMELNKEQYGRSGVKSMKLIELERNKEIYGSKIYSGESEPIQPYKPNHILDLAPSLAELPYGCFYHYLSIPDSNYLACFKPNSGCAGSADFTRLKAELVKFGQGNKIEKYIGIFKEYFTHLGHQRDVLQFKKLFEIEPYDYIVEKNIGYIIEKDELKREINSFLNFHIADYKNFIKDIHKELNHKI